jgi:hypothetical protein
VLAAHPARAACFRTGSLTGSERGLEHAAARWMLSGGLPVTGAAHRQSLPGRAVGLHLSTMIPWW